MQGWRGIHTHEIRTCRGDMRGARPHAASPASHAKRANGVTAGKRAMDIILALALAVIVALPLLLLIILLLLVEGRPIFHLSERMKAPGRSFRLVKLRSMRPAPGGDSVTGGDKAARISRLQRVLRASRADELPQLWNVLRGDMSMVGPRPPIPRMVAAHPALYARVLRSRPGITGLATLRFHAHEERILARCRSQAETESAYRRRCVERKARIDLIYQRNHSLWLDLRIIGETALLPLRRALRGLSASREARERAQDDGRDAGATGRRMWRPAMAISRRSRRDSVTASATGLSPCPANHVRVASPAIRPHANIRPAIRPDLRRGAGPPHRAGRGPPPG